MQGARSLIETNRWAWSKLRKRVMTRDGWTCRVCGEPAQEVDHIIPRIAGGTDALDNLRAICKGCHRRRWAGAAPVTNQRPRRPSIFSGRPTEPVATITADYTRRRADDGAA